MGYERTIVTIRYLEKEQSGEGVFDHQPLFAVFENCTSFSVDTSTTLSEVFSKVSTRNLGNVLSIIIEPDTESYLQRPSLDIG